MEFTIEEIKKLLEGLEFLEEYDTQFYDGGVTAREKLEDLLEDKTIEGTSPLHVDIYV